MSETSQVGEEGANGLRVNVDVVGEEVSREVIARYREKLVWMLHIPEWEPLYLRGLEELNLPCPRKGIGMQALLGSLLIEHKFTLLRWVVCNFRGRLTSAVGEVLDQYFGQGLLKHRSLDVYLSEKQWFLLRDEIVFKMGQEHRRYKNAQSYLFKKYQSLVNVRVKSMVFDASKRADAFQEGCIGLVHAIDKADASNSSLGSYARSWISRHIQNFIVGQRFTVHVPLNLASQMLQLNARSENSGHCDSVDSGAEKDKLVALIYERLRQPNMSIDEFVHYEPAVAEGSEEDLRDGVSLSDIGEKIRLGIERLTDKQQEVLVLRYGLREGQGAHTLSAIAKKIGISHQQVCMREKRALQKIETFLKPLYNELYG